MATTAQGRTPVHLWIVGILSLLWGCMGAYDYVMTRMHNLAYFKTMMPNADPTTVYAFLDGMPIYASIGWGLGVWGGLLGAVLLLVRSRYAVWAYAASFVGMLLSFGLAFQLPLIVLALVRIGIIEVAQLKKMRRIVYFALTIIAAVIVPDVATGMIALMIPLVLLYEFGILLASWNTRKPATEPD